MGIGIYKYNKQMNKICFTEEVPKILLTEPKIMEQLTYDYESFKIFILNSLETPISDEENTFKLRGKPNHYVRFEEVDVNGEIIGIVIDVTEEILKLKKLEEEKDIDTLTGLFSRRGIEDNISILFREEREIGYSALIMIDADDLKEINDHYGHEKGDTYLKKISEILKDFGTKSSIAGRQGGDEFVLFLYQYESREELDKAINKLIELQEGSVACLDDNLSVPLRFSFGFSVRKNETDYQSLLREADKKMYENKSERKKRI